MGHPARTLSSCAQHGPRASVAPSAGAVIMRILSARVTAIRVNRAAARVEAVVVLRVEPGDDSAREIRVPTSAPIVATGAAPLKDRLIVSAKLILTMSTDAGVVEEADTNRDAA